ncbi:MAG: lipoyl synthase [SAR202 cluster bacterium]|nr:lipoyl synthase [Chloroflexota bacterium]MDP6425690.1 lipoyl synthase [Dehalococcoidia bacterium]MDP7231660.1 lipoyl synthase [Dehalococcoidia bacterium]MDP7613518.1 lipoyl synthase [Dehalococcoidia bacterium]MQG47618.1 lipoyl synthase [SAR202 cluster bacterium]
MTVERRLPEWFKVKAPGSTNFIELRSQIQGANLNTVCEEAACPNIGDCWDRGTATFMILGDICTRSCSYCNVKTGRPITLDRTEPFRVAVTVKRMNLKYAVITSVDRDDLEDYGSSFFAETIKQVRHLSPSCNVEVLIPDFEGSRKSLVKVLNAQPQVLNHNIETVRRVFKKVRPRGNYDVSLDLLRNVKKINGNMPTKSGMMVGLGETKDEILRTMKDLRNVGCDLLTIGQYLRPSKKHHPLIRFYHPDEFAKLKELGLEMEFKHVASGPLVRSSYHADEQHDAVLDKLLQKPASQQ